VIDRLLHLPQGWLDDPARLQAAGVPDRVGLATKPELTRRMLERVLGAGVPAGWQRWLLVRRSLRTGEPAYYVCAGPTGLPLVALVRVAGSRWQVEEAFQAGKGLCGLGQHQVRRWRCWYRWVTLAMLAYAFLVVAAVTEHAQRPAPPWMVELTCSETQHLLAALVAVPVADRGHRLRWSWWRRRHQARARACHYRQQANGP
jgi:SRSO17 transposase